jgi:hypothetical protein
MAHDLGTKVSTIELRRGRQPEEYLIDHHDLVVDGESLVGEGRVPEFDCGGPAEQRALIEQLAGRAPGSLPALPLR